MYVVVCVQLAHFSSRWLKGYIYSSCYYYHQIGSIHLSHCYHIFLPWLCAWDACYIIFCHVLQIRAGKTGNLFSLLLCKYSDTFWLADRVRLFVHYPSSFSSLCKLIWGHWTYKISGRYILSSVWVRLSIFSQLSVIQYMGLCVFSLPISLVMIERIYTLSFYHLRIGSMNFYPLFRVRSWNNGVRCMFFHILIGWKWAPSVSYLTMDQYTGRVHQA